MKKLILIVLIVSWSSVVYAKNCTTGKPCGDSCISMSYTCNIGTIPSVIVKNSQTISFGVAPTVFIGGTGKVSATATSGLTVSFSSKTSNICTVYGSTVTSVTSGTCTIAADQAGNTSYNAATQVMQNISISAVTLPTCTLTASPSSISAGSNSLLVANCNPTATSYTWSSNAGFSSTNASGNVTPSLTTTYSVIGNNAGGMGKTSSVTVTVTPSKASQIIGGRVTAVADGDTLTFLDADNISHKVRLAEIDAPEKCQAYGVESKNSLVALALNKAADLVVDTTDKYGREVGKITVAGQAESANKMQLRLGMAWVYDQYATDTSLDSLEMSARQSHLGLWADANPMEPWEWRHGGYGCSRDPETSVTSSATDTSGASEVGVGQAIVVTEFFNHNLKHYFLTASESEAIGIDNGAAGDGWERTGNTFQAWNINTTIAEAIAVCRFYAKGPNSHFFTADPSECQSLRDMESTGKAAAEKAGVPFLGWQYEGADFKVKVPVSGTCSTETETIYRAYNNRASQGDTNHRFSPWQQDIDSLQSQGWISEGAAMCAPM